MTIALVDVGTTANDGTGDPLRTAFQTVNTALTRLDDTVDVQTGYVLLKDDSGSTGVAVTTAGNVGIGTTSPAAPFDVYGANVTKAATITAITSGYSDFTPFLNTAFSSLLVKGNNNGYAGITIANPNTGAQASALAFADTVSGDAGLISYTHSDDSMTFSSGGVARFAINSLGDFTWRNAGATVGMTWDASANSNAGGLGIGLTTPHGSLSVLAQGRVVTIGNSGNANVPVLKSRTVDDTGYAFMSYDAFDHQFKVSGTNALKLADGGYAYFYNAGAGIGMTWDASANSNAGGLGIGTTAPTEALDVNSDAIRVRSSQTPASASATGDAGQICWDSSYIYVCTATNTWKRAAIATW